MFLFVCFRELVSSSFSFAPFERYLRNPGSNFTSPQSTSSQSQIYMFYNDNLPLFVNIKFAGDCVAKSWQLAKGSFWHWWFGIKHQLFSPA